MIVSDATAAIGHWFEHNIWETVFGSGGLLGVLLTIFDRWRTRSRFGIRPKIDRNERVIVDIVATKQRYISAIKVVFVKPRIYLWLRRLRSTDPATMLPIETLAEGDGDAIPLIPDKPNIYGGDLPKVKLLPPRWNPFGSAHVRRWHRSELRLSVAASGKNYYMRLKRAPGLIPRARPAEESGLPDPAEAVQREAPPNPKAARKPKAVRTPGSQGSDQVRPLPKPPPSAQR
jgi:hypothetical protein